MNFNPLFNLSEALQRHIEIKASQPFLLNHKTMQSSAELLTNVHDGSDSCH